MDKQPPSQKEFLVLRSEQDPNEKKTPVMMNFIANSYLVDVYGNEGFTKDLFEVFKSLNEIVFKSGEEMWGNVCYERKKANTNFIDAFPEQKLSLISRRRNIARIAPHIDSIIEIGFNAGHSAALWLMINEKINYYGIDIAKREYMKSCASFMANKFGERFNLFIGDSRTEMQEIDKKINQKIDLIHIDGGHTYEVADSDLLNSINISKKLNTKFILLDDTNVERIRTAANKYIIKGLLQSESLNGSWEDISNSLLRILV
tara:strand:+ start:78 stop:857 length:780 start_codon:yes stop_codon:yes gene_type:complete